MACKQLACEGIDDFLKLIQAEEGKSDIYILFTGKDDPATGQSWCPDCVKAEPVIEKCLPKIKEDATFIVCVVGDRPTWKDPQCKFRINAKTKLTGIPTLMKWDTPQRLGDTACSDENLVSMLFEE